MRELDKNGFCDDLTKMFCIYTHLSEFAPVTAREFTESVEQAYQRYRNETIFHARVQRLVAVVLDLAEKNIR